MSGKNINLKTWIAVTMFVLLTCAGKAQDNNRIKKQTETENVVNTKDSLLNCAYKLFNDKILRDYLYIPNGNVMHKRWHTFIDIMDAGFIKHYDMFSAKQGNSNAKLFWSLVKDGVYKEIYNTDNCVYINAQTNPNLCAMDNVIFADYAISCDNGVKDTCSTAYAFGGDYIDLKNEHVAKYSKEIKQICAEIRRVQKAAIKQK